MRSKMIVISSTDIALGFRLSGVDVKEADTIQEAEEALEQIVLGSDYGMVAVDEGYMDKFSDRLKRLLHDAQFPIVVPFPGKEANIWKMEDRLDYVASLIKSAIGYHIKLTR